MEDELKKFITRISEETGESEHRVEIAFCKDPPDERGGGYYWKATIIYTLPNSRKGHTSTAQGYGSAIGEAAFDGVAAYKRAVGYGYAKKGS